MRVLRTLRRLVTEIVATSPPKAVATIVLTTGLSFTEGVGLLLLMPLLELVGINRPTTMPNVAETFAAGFAAVGMAPTLGSVLVLFVIIAALRAVLLRSQSWVNAALREEFTSTLRVRVYQAIAAAEWKFLVTRRPSDFVHVLTGEITRVGSAGFQLIGLVGVVAVSLVYLGLAFHFSPVTAVLVSLCAGGLAWAARGRLDEARVLGGRASAARGKMHAAIAEHVGSMKTAKSYGAADRHADTFIRLSDELRDVNLKVTREESDLQQSLELASTALLALIVFVAFELLHISAAQLLVLLVIFARLMPRLVTVYRRVQALAGALAAVEVVTNLEQECREAAEPQATDDRALVLATSIRFEGVSFAYLRRGGAPALRDLNLRIEAGLTTAIVGSSGAGKSTLADLLIGLLSPTVGRVLVDGEPLSADRLAGWRRHVGYVPQDTFLFHDTVRANLVWARPEAGDEDVWRALRLASAEDFVTGLPNGLDTTIGERGVLVSGGERQRLSLARALLRWPRVLVLDEATSSLDSETERRIQQAIEGLHREMTIVIVTHRLSMISGADIIHVLDGGRLVESGTWADLLARPNGRFLSLCRAQGIYSRPAPAQPSYRPRLDSVSR